MSCPCSAVLLKMLSDFVSTTLFFNVFIVHVALFPEVTGSAILLRRHLLLDALDLNSQQLLKLIR